MAGFLFVVEELCRRPRVHGGTQLQANPSDVCFMIRSQMSGVQTGLYGMCIRI